MRHQADGQLRHASKLKPSLMMPCPVCAGRMVYHGRRRIAADIEDTVYACRRCGAELIRTVMARPVNGAEAALTATRRFPLGDACGQPTKAASSDLPEHSVAEQAEWIGKGLQHFEVIVALADEDFGGLAGCLDRCGEVAGLPLKFRRLVSAVSRAQAARCSLSRWRMALSAFSISSVNRTYLERFDSRTGLRSYMPLDSTAPLMKAGGQAVAGQSWVSAQPARCEPDECEVEMKPAGIAAEFAASRNIKPMARQT